MKVTKLSECEYTILGDKSATYTVNLLDNNRKGSCNCSDFRFRILPKWRRHDDSQPCKHIIFVLGFLMWNKLN